MDFWQSAQFWLVKRLVDFAWDLAWFLAFLALVLIIAALKEGWFDRRK